MRCQAAVDGSGIDPWHLAATIEGLRLQFGAAARIADRGAIFNAARHALTLHQWLQEPDFDQDGEVQRAERLLKAEPGSVLLLAAAKGSEFGLKRARPAEPCERPLCASGSARGCSVRRCR